jgi:hypothetical protein
MCPCLVAELTGGDGDPVLAARVPRLLQHNSLQRWNTIFKLKRKEYISKSFSRNVLKYKKTLKYNRKLCTPFKNLAQHKSLSGSVWIRFDSALLDPDPDDKKNFLAKV